MKKHIASMLTVMLMLSFAACENASDEISVQTDPHATESNSINITEETAQAAKPNAEEPALSLLNCSTNEDGAYYADQTAWSASNDYTLFRKYFFGTWEGSFRFPECPEQESLIIDDTEKSFVMTETGIKMLDGFYETGAGAFAFMIGSDCGSAILWINSDEPDTMYIVWGGSTSPLWSRNENGEYSTDPIIYSLRKTDVPLNEPEDNFLSIFKLREMAREYEIDPILLVNIEYEINGMALYHDDWYQFYPMYLVSEAKDKIVIRTSVGNVGDIDLKPVDVICTFEKAEGEWNRSVELF
jgi:hypothetical protein